MAQCSRQLGPIKKDMFDFADQYGFGVSQHLLVQSTSYTNFSSRRKKVLANSKAYLWKKLSIANRIFIIGWKDLDTTDPVPVVEEVFYRRGRMFVVRLHDYDECKPTTLSWDGSGILTSPARVETLLEQTK